MESNGKDNIRGIDISSWQTGINYRKVKEFGDVVIIKATEGVDYVDSMLEKHYEGAKSAGLKVGFYHFFSDKTNPIEQAKDFWNAIKNKKFEVIPVLDIETSKRSKKEVTDRCILFLNEMKRLSGFDCIIYTYTNFARTKLDTRLSKYLLWIAEYGVNWPGSNGIWTSWVGFQYTDKAKVPGVPNLCDANKFTEGIYINGGRKKVKYIVIYNNGADQRAAEYLADFLSCPTISNSRAFDYSTVEHVYAVGYTKEHYTSYVEKVISGDGRYSTLEAVLKYIRENS
ncbi:GH25 family lysozyme [Clostridium niameyense]|uniref:GH25 family lysozyme n=1 Tax=Clostridium niameyense TaxID=1622073 RepID=UPI00067F72DB|nr:GH25 family lysozyme [Clostridium niameyense]